MVQESAHLLRVQLSRLRTRLRGGWRIPSASARGEYVLLAPDAALPDGYRPVRPDVPSGPCAGDRRPCPECDGEMRPSATRCMRCSRRLRAARMRPGTNACPRCNGWKDWDSACCYLCDMARRQHRTEGVA